MPFSQGSKAGLAFAVQTDFSTPATTGFKSLPYSTHTLDLTKQRVQGTDQQPDRMPRHDRHGNRNAVGDIAFDLRAAEYDDFLESVMFGVWDASPVGPDELKFGSTQKFFTIQDYASDIDQARLFTGMGVSQAAFSISPNQMVTTTLSMVGKNMTVSSTEENVAAAGLNSPFDSYSGAITLGNAGGSLSAVATVTGIDFTINNSLAPTFVVGSSTAPELEYGMANVEGTITAYFDDLSLVNRFLDEVESALSVTVDDPTGTNDYGFLFPRIKFNGAAIPVAGPTSRIITIPFVALYDTTENSSLVITRPDST
tara:strand:- start:38 stop:973 length:936 start_codon:yes stop_codon:yes gene_type:complete